MNIEGGCSYCVPNKSGIRRAIYFQEFEMSNRRLKRNTTKIFRDRNKKKSYFIGTKSIDYVGDGAVMNRNNGFIMKKYINFCPMCSRDLKT